MGRGRFKGPPLLVGAFLLLSFVNLAVARTSATPEKPETFVERIQNKTHICPEWLAKFATFRVIPWTAPYKLTMHLGKATFYPLVALAKAGYHGVKMIRHPTKIRDSISVAFKSFKKDLLHAGAYLALVGVTSLTNISYRKFDSQINVAVKPESHVAVVNGFPSDDKLHKYVAYRFRHRFSEVKNADYLDSDNWYDAIASLQKIADEEGPFNVLELHGHAAPGLMIIKGDSISASEINLLLQADPDGKQPPKLTRLLLELRKRGIMAPNGVIVLYGCSAGRGKAGFQLSSSVGQILSKDGADVYASTVEIQSNMLDQFFLNGGSDPPQSLAMLHEPVDMVFPILRLMRIAKQLSNPEDNLLFIDYNQVCGVKVPPRDG